MIFIKINGKIIYFSRSKVPHDYRDKGIKYFRHLSVVSFLPQALKISIPNIVGSSISLFKDTTLVLIIGLLDMLAMVGLTTADPYWLGRETEGYVFVTIVMWVMLYSMSRYSRKLELRFNTENIN